MLTARSPATADATVAAIETAAPGTRVDVHYGDFSNLALVAALGREIVSCHSRIDALTNNAGIHAFKSRITADGYAEMIAVNYLAPCLLTYICRRPWSGRRHHGLSPSHRKPRDRPQDLMPAPRSSTNSPVPPAAPRRSTAGPK